MSVLIKGLNLKPCKDGFGGKGLVIIGYDDKLYAVAREQIIPLPDHGDLIDRDALKEPVGSYLPIKWTYEYGHIITWKDISTATAIIPAERSEE